MCGGNPLSGQCGLCRSEGEFCLIRGTQTGLGSGDLVRRSYNDVPGGSQNCEFTCFQGNLYNLEAWFLQNVFCGIKKICFFFYHVSIPGYIYLRGKKTRSSGVSYLTWKLFRLEMKSHL